MNRLYTDFLRVGMGHGTLMSPDHSLFFNLQIERDESDDDDEEPSIFNSINIDLITLEQKIFMNEALILHNFYRGLHGVAPLKLSYSLSVLAQEYAKVLATNKVFLKRDHTQILGQNVALLSVNDVNNAGEFATTLWYNEIRNHEFGDSYYNKNSERFSQLVWKKSKKVGFGMAQTPECIIVVAYYDPPGNINGEYEQNVPNL